MTNSTAIPDGGITKVPSAAVTPFAPPRKWLKGGLLRLLPALGPILLFVIWDVAVRTKLVSPILLPLPGATLATLVEGLWGGSLLTDFGYTLLRTFEAFAAAAIIGVPLGILLGSNLRAYSSVEFLIDFFARRHHPP